MLAMLLKEREKREGEKEDAGGPKHMAVRTSPLSSNVALPCVLLFFAAVGLLDAWLFFKGCIAAPELLDPDALCDFFGVILPLFLLSVLVSNVSGLIRVGVGGVVYKVAGTQRSRTRKTSIGRVEDGFSTIRRCCCRCRCGCRSGQGSVLTKSLQDMGHAFPGLDRVVHELVDTKCFDSSCKTPLEFTDNPCLCLHLCPFWILGMDGKGLGLLDLHYPHVVQVLCASDHGLCAGVHLGLFDNICVRVLDKPPAPSREDALLEDQTGGAEDTCDGVDLAINDIASDDVGCERVWIPEPEGISDIVPCVLERRCVLVKLDHCV